MVSRILLCFNGLMIPFIVKLRGEAHIGGRERGMEGAREEMEEEWMDGQEGERQTERWRRWGDMK